LSAEKISFTLNITTVLTSVQALSRTKKETLSITQKKSESLSITKKAVFSLEL